MAKRRIQAIDLEGGTELEGLGTVTVMSAMGSSVRILTSTGYDQTVSPTKLYVLADNAEGSEAD